VIHIKENRMKNKYLTSDFIVDRFQGLPAMIIFFSIFKQIDLQLNTRKGKPGVTQTGDNYPEKLNQ
jgi:hypothetical protein